MGKYKEADLSRLKRLSAAERPTKVSVTEFARPLEPAAAAALLRSLPDQLAAKALREVIARTVAAHRERRPVVLMLGGHVIKVGVSPCFIELLERGVITHVAMNGAAAIHDVEIARLGRTSEDVEANLATGSFGMVDETGTFMNEVAKVAARAGLGLGEAWGRALEDEPAPHRDVSLLARAWRRSVPATVHVALGTDTIHYDPGCDGGALGETSLRDFRVLAGTLAGGPRRGGVECRLRRAHAGGVPQGPHGGEEPRRQPRRPDDGQLRPAPALPAARERGRAPDARRGSARLLPDRSSRDPDAALLRRSRGWNRGRNRVVRNALRGRCLRGFRDWQGGVSIDSEGTRARYSQSPGRLSRPQTADDRRRRTFRDARCYSIAA
jgi:hypothetical protein